MKHFKLFLPVFVMMISSHLLAQGITVSGKVIDAKTQEPIIGATVVTAAQEGTITDYDGLFYISATEGEMLTISYVGYKDVQVAAKSSLTISLEEATEELEELVVTGYTAQRKVDLTGAVSVVDVDDLKKQNENNPMKGLQGKLPGVTITADGNPSGAATVRIRGIGTLNNNDPLYIIDGVPTKSGMHELNPNDIENIQVLKDASSASIYGSRAANGVIIINTKRGKDGKVNVDFDASVGVNQYTNRMSVLNTEQFGQVMWQAYVNDGQNPNSNSLGYHYNWGYNAQGVPTLNSMYLDKYLDAAGTTPAADTDWFDAITRTGVTQQYNLAVSHGTEKGHSFFSLGYYKNMGVIKYTDFDRFSGRVNSDYKLFKGKVTIGENLTFNRTSEVASPAGILENALQFNTTLPIYTTDGQYAGPVGGYPDRENPLARLDRNKDNRYIYWRLFGDAFLDIELYKGLHVRTTGGIDYAQKQQRIFTYPITEGTVATTTNAVEAKQEHWMKWMWNAIATYNFSVGKHRGDAMIGIELNRENDVWFSGYKEDYTILSTDYMWPSAGTGTAQAYGSGEGYSLLSYFAKVNYSYADRYLVSVTVRRDGSSRFGKNNKFATFPAVSLGWRMSEERWMSPTRKVLDNLKIRASWGQTGNQEISNIARYTIYQANYGVSENGGQSYGTGYDIAGTNGGIILPSGFMRSQIGNDDLRWETTSQTDAGLDFAMFNNQFYGSFDWFYKRTKDILVYMAGISAMGEGAYQWINAGEMENMGEELLLGYRGEKHGFKWDISGNLSHYDNKITKLPETVAANGTYGGNGVKSVVGHPMGAQVGYVADGIFTCQEDIDNHAKQDGAGVGRMRWKDLNGDGVISEADQDWIYSPVPAITYGLNFAFEYKGFDLTLFFAGVQGVDVITDLKKETDLWAGLNISNLNKGTRLLDAWSPSNPNSTIPALTLSDNNNEKRVSSYWVEDGSYFKLKNLQLGYNLPQSALDKMHMRRWRFFASLQNVFTIHSKSFTGVDPENPNFGYPIPLTFTFGTNISF
ncbi:MAG: TonB-dependent receptor [Paludibacteraceae bacterium]|nr:TonB-dependent receptor [Paludibacteraceae bacterium]